MAGVIVFNVVNVPISGGLEKYCCFDVWFMSLYQSKQCDFVCDLPLPDTRLKHSVYIFVPPCVLCIYKFYFDALFLNVVSHFLKRVLNFQVLFFIFLFSQWLWYFTCVRERERFWLHLQHFWLNCCWLVWQTHTYGSGDCGPCQGALGRYAAITCDYFFKTVMEKQTFSHQRSLKHLRAKLFSMNTDPEEFLKLCFRCFALKLGAK